MIRARMRFDGGTKLAQELRAMSARLRTNVVVSALMSAAEPMRSTVARFAPHEPGAPDIRANIVVSRVRAERGAVTVAVGPAVGYRYGFYQEYGTRFHSAQPFMRPAFDSQAEGALRRIGVEMWQIIIGRGGGTERSTSGRNL